MSFFWLGWHFWVRVWIDGCWFQIGCLSKSCYFDGAITEPRYQTFRVADSCLGCPVWLWIDGLIASVVIMAVVSGLASLAFLAIGPRNQALLHFGWVDLFLLPDWLSFYRRLSFGFS